MSPRHFIGWVARWCWMDFALRTECFELLRLPGDALRETGAGLWTRECALDKVSQAAITAVVQEWLGS